MRPAFCELGYACRKSLVGPPLACGGQFYFHTQLIGLALGQVAQGIFRTALSGADEQKLRLPFSANPLMFDGVTWKGRLRNLVFILPLIKSGGKNMTPYSTLAPPEEERETSEPASAPLASHWARLQISPNTVQHALFEEALLEMSTTRPGRRTLDFVSSLALHILLIATFILIPLYYTEAIDLKQFTQTFLVAPPPPPPPPPPAAPSVLKVRSTVKRVFMSGGKLLAPTAIPAKIAMIKEDELPPDVGIGVAGGVPGGVPGGQAGGVIGGIISSAPKTYVPIAPAAPAPKAPIRVGGRIMPPRQIYAPEPVYPLLAKQAKIQGEVVVDAVIDAQGNVVQMQVVSGHPLLLQAALETLRKWRYQPTYLNEEPISVQLYVTIRFRLS